MTLFLWKQLHHSFVTVSPMRVYYCSSVQIASCCKSKPARASTNVKVFVTDCRRVNIQDSPVENTKSLSLQFSFTCLLSFYYCGEILKYCLLFSFTLFNDHKQYVWMFKYIQKRIWATYYHITCQTMTPNLCYASNNVTLQPKLLQLITIYVIF